MFRIAQLALFSLLVSCSSLTGLKSVSEKIRSPQRQSKALTMAWAKNLDHDYVSGNLSIGSASPLIHEGLLYAGSLKGVMSCYHLDSGRPVWTQDEGQALNGQARAYKNMLLYGSVEGRVFARHYLTGELIYSIDVGSPIESAPVISQGRMFFHLRDHRIIAMDVTSGKVFWSYKRSVPFTTTLQRVSLPLIHENRLIVGFADGHLAALSIEEGVVLWERALHRSNKFVDVDVSPVIYQGQVVAGSAAGDLSFLDPQTGALSGSLDFTVAHTPIIVGDDLLVGSVFGEIARIGPNLEIVKRKKLLEEGISSMVYWKNGLSVATMSGKFFHLDQKLNIVDSFDLGHELSSVFGAVEVSKTHMAFSSSRNRLYVFR